MKGFQKLTLNKRRWICPNCKTHHICGWNATKNILAKDLSQILIT